MKVSRVLLAVSAALLITSSAHGHVGLIYPLSRYGPNILKFPPCGLGGGTRTTNVTVLEPGSTIDIVWDEYIDHPGHFRVAFDADGDDDFVDPACMSGCNTRTPVIEFYSNDTVLLDNIPDTPRGGEGGVRLTLPDIECENCTLQVIQVMYDKPPYTAPDAGDDLYYQCVDLVLRRSVPLPTATATHSPSPLETPTPSATVSPTEGAPTPGPTCDGDCDGSGAVSVDELVKMITIALGNADMSICLAGDKDGGGSIQVDDIVAALRSTLVGCNE